MKIKKKNRFIRRYAGINKNEETKISYTEVRYILGHMKPCEGMKQIYKTVEDKTVKDIENRY